MLLLCNTMKEFINWCLDNLNLIIIVGSGVIEFILLLLFKRYKVVDNSLHEDIIQYVKDAETFYGAGHGKDKFQFVIDKICATHNYNKIYALFHFGTIIENILSTPQKKDKKNE